MTGIPLPIVVDDNPARMDRHATEFVYAVGVWKKKFIVDRVYGDLKLAIAYCNERGGNTKYRWVVIRIGLGEDWIYSDEVHTKGPEQ